MIKKRCGWCTNHPLYMKYHDYEWGVPVYDDEKLFTMLILEGMQAGLNWLTILKKREAFYKAFANFNPEKMARFTPAKVQKLLQNENIIRHRLKIESAVTNAKAYLKIKEQQNFSDFIWQFVEGVPKQNHWRTLNQVPTSTPQSDQMANVLKKHNFKFVGTTICYAFMQAVGMVNDHLVECFRYSQIK